jgi:antitoxin ParD1/3/4
LASTTFCDEGVESSADGALINDLNRIDKRKYPGNVNCMNVSLPSALEEFVSSQVKSGEFGDASEVVREALRLLRDERETRAMKEMRAAFAGVDASGGKGEPSASDRAAIQTLIRDRRSSKRQPCPIDQDEWQSQ